MNNPDILKGWVAESGQLATEVIDPCYIAAVAAGDLQRWHPGFDPKKAHSFMHVAADDGDGRGPYVRADTGSFSNNWLQEMRDVMQKLKLRPFPTVSGPTTMLIDEEIGQLNTGPMNGWKVVLWVTVRNLDNSQQTVHLDVITWQNLGNGTVAQSMFTWRPYRKVEQSLKGLIRNERGIARGTQAR